jgi:2-C-methyl-D-erythritol 4-phosphate cytidylyltransferase
MTRAVVIVAAGSGQRMSEPNKALLPIGGEPAIAHSIRAAALARDVAWIVVVTRDDLVPEIAAIASDLGIDQPVAIVVGGATRTESVTNGVEKAAALGANLVAVHDAARPLIRSAQFEAVFEAAERTGAAILAAPVADTLKRAGDDGLIESTVDRSGLWAAQTPQAFRTAELLAALIDARRMNRSATDEAGLYEAMGKPVAIVRGDPGNMKLTYPGDQAIAAALFARRASDDGDPA